MAVSLVKEERFGVSRNYPVTGVKHRVRLIRGRHSKMSLCGRRMAYVYPESKFKQPWSLLFALGTCFVCDRIHEKQHSA